MLKLLGLVSCEKRMREMRRSDDLSFDNCRKSNQSVFLTVDNKQHIVCCEKNKTCKDAGCLCTVLRSVMSVLDYFVQHEHKIHREKI